MHDTLIVGGGVIGLSLAYELATRGQRVKVVDRNEPAREASWAGAGILPPENVATAVEPFDRLAALSVELHAEWAERLQHETGIDNGFRRCGALYIARTEAEYRDVETMARAYATRQVEYRLLDHDELTRLEPNLVGVPLIGAWLAASECQIRNPRHLKALLAACLARGVEILSGVETHDFEQRAGRIAAAITSAGRLEAGQYCITSGAWSRRLLNRLGMDVPLVPIRGQILLLASPTRLLQRIVNEGPRYLVPRDDGRTLVGSTEEEAGFDKRTTAAGIGGLLQLAIDLVPQLASAQIERTWSGLRPATVDRRPIIGRLPQCENAYVATGHFRSGLTLSPGTALLLAQCITGEQPSIPLESFRPDRF